MGSSRIRAQTRVPCIGRRILNHCTTREVLISLFESQLISILDSICYLSSPLPCNITFTGWGIRMRSSLGAIILLPQVCKNICTGGPWRVNRTPSCTVSGSFLEPFSAAPSLPPPPPRNPLHPPPPSPLEAPHPGCPDPPLSRTAIIFGSPGPVRCGKIKRKEREGARKRRAGRGEGRETWKLRL